MKEITISFSPEELVELAKQLYLGSYMTIHFPYDNEELADQIFNKVCATGFNEVPELEAFRHGGLTETPFNISMEISNDCQAIVDEFQASSIDDYLPYALADRDFEEKYGKQNPFTVLENPKLLKELKDIQEKYKVEFERYGVLHLRLEDK